MNPIRRRRRHVRRRRYARNPVSVNAILRDLLMPAATGAVGAIANDALFTYLPLPDALKAPGIPRYATKALTAIGLSMLAAMVVSKKVATEMGVGALTTLAAEIARNMLATTVPAVAVEGMGLYTMGYYNPAVVAGGGVGYYTRGSAGQGTLPSPLTQDSQLHGMGHAVENGYVYN